MTMAIVRPLLAALLGLSHSAAASARDEAQATSGVPQSPAASERAPRGNPLWGIPVQQLRPILVETDPVAILSSVDQPVPSVNNWGIAQWGGAYFIFHHISDTPSSYVDRYTPGKGTGDRPRSASLSNTGAGVVTTLGRQSSGTPS